MPPGFTLTQTVPSFSQKETNADPPQSTELERLLEGKTKKGLGLDRRTASSPPQSSTSKRPLETSDSSPPCADYSTIREAQPPGPQGTEAGEGAGREGELTGCFLTS